MTEDRKVTGNEGIVDPDVSRAYRDAATERPPASLDRAVLEQARAAVAPAAFSRYANTIHWLRPMAWAATIFLCLAIVVETLQFAPAPSDALLGPASQADRFDAPAPASKSLLTEQQDARSPPAEADEDKGPDDAVADELQQLKKEKLDSNFATSSPGEAGRLDSSDVDALRVDETPQLDMAEEEARQLDGGSRGVASDAPLPAPARSLESDAADRSEPEPQSRAAPASAVAAFESVVEQCSDEQRESENAWLACIEELEAAGLEEAAARERDLFRTAHPDVD